MENPILNNFIIILACLFITSCQKDDEMQKKADNTVLFFLAADNDLYNNATQDLDGTTHSLIKEALKNGDGWGNVYVYVDGAKDGATLYRYDKYENQEIIQTPVKKYGSVNSCSKELMKSVLKTVFRSSERTTHNSLVLWSHGSGWWPSAIKYGSFSRSFGVDSNGRSIDIPELAEAIGECCPKLDMILMDACLMSCVEVAYELRNNAKYLVSSPTEILANSFPYYTITPLTAKEKPEPVEIAREYLRYYNEDYTFHYASVNCIDLSLMDEMAVKWKKLMRKGLPSSWNDIQYYDRTDRHVFYDMKQTAHSTGAGEEDIADFDNTYSKAVIYSGHTADFLGIPLKSGGPSVYRFSQDRALDAYYKTLSWYRDTQPSDNITTCNRQ